MQKRMQERLEELRASYKEDLEYFNQLQNEIQKQQEILISERAIIQELESLLGEKVTALKKGKGENNQDKEYQDKANQDKEE